VYSNPIRFSVHQWLPLPRKSCGECIAMQGRNYQMSMFYHRAIVVFFPHHVIPRDSTPWNDSKGAVPSNSNETTTLIYNTALEVTYRRCGLQFSSVTYLPCSRLARKPRCTLLSCLRRCLRRGCCWMELLFWSHNGNCGRDGHTSFFTPMCYSAGIVFGTPAGQNACQVACNLLIPA
jgi:hypothetical protein